MKKMLLLFFMLCCSWLTIFSQTEETILDTAVTDSDVNIGAVDATEEDEKEQEFKQPTLRVVPKDSVASIKNRPGFEYMRFIDSFYKHKKAPVAKVTEVEEEEAPPTPGLFDNAGFRMLYWGLAFAVVLFLLWKLFFSSSALFARNRKIHPETAEVIEEEITLNQMDQLVEKAIRAKDYRLATRYLFLQTLTLLGEKELLLLAPQKTNYQYVRELDGKSYQDSFSALTLRYEYAWFGNFALVLSQFNEIHNGFKKFREQVG
jgi:hypothetical protein